MNAGTSVPMGWIEGSTEAHRRFERLIEGLTDDAARRPTLLGDWTVGHLLTHLARNADSHTGVVEAAQRGQMIERYPGGSAQREGDIQAGAGRPASTLIADVREANRRLEDAWAATNEETWATGLGLRLGGVVPIADGVRLRWREMEIHSIDLDLPASPGWDDLPPAYVDLEWQLMFTSLPGRVPEGTTVLLVPGDRPSRVAGTGENRVLVRAAPNRILQWLFGRGGEPSWPQLRPWE